MALPTTVIDEAAEQEKGKKGGKNDKDSRRLSEVEKRQEKEDDDLQWTGSQTAHRSDKRRTGSRGTDDSESISTDRLSTSTTSRLTESTHFSQKNNSVVMKDQKKAAKVDLTSMERHRNMTTKQMTEAEVYIHLNIYMNIHAYDYAYDCSFIYM